MFPDLITVYHYVDGQYVRGVISGCFCYDTKQSTLNRTGMQNTDTFVVVIDTMIDMAFSEGYDMVVNGECNFEIDNTSEATISNSIKELKTNHDVYTISSVERNLYGDIPNIKLSCK